MVHSCLNARHNGLFICVTNSPDNLSSWCRISVVGLDRAKLRGFYLFQSFSFIVVIVLSFLLQSTFNKRQFLANHC